MTEMRRLQNRIMFGHAQRDEDVQSGVELGMLNQVNTDVSHVTVQTRGKDAKSLNSSLFYSCCIHLSLYLIIFIIHPFSWYLHITVSKKAQKAFGFLAKKPEGSGFTTAFGITAPAAPVCILFFFFSTSLLPMIYLFLLQAQTSANSQKSYFGAATSFNPSRI